MHHDVECIVMEAHRVPPPSLSDFAMFSPFTEGPRAPERPFQALAECAWTSAGVGEEEGIREGFEAWFC